MCLCNIKSEDMNPKPIVRKINQFLDEAKVGTIISVHSHINYTIIINLYVNSLIIFKDKSNLYLCITMILTCTLQGVIRTKYTVCILFIFYCN